MDEQTRGVWTIAATPFTEDGAVDFASVDRLVDFYVEEGVHGVTLLGVMGEAPKLSSEEQSAFMTHALRRIDGRVPAMVGVSNPGMDNLVALAHRAMDAGATGVMVAAVPGPRTDDQVYAYFARVLERLGAEVPVCLQDFPPATTVWMSVAVVNRLIDDFPQLVVFKHEDCPGMRKLSALRRGPEQGHRRVAILTGNGGIHIPQELARGADGVMTGFPFPAMLVEVWERFAAGDAEGAEDLYDLYLPVLRNEHQPGLSLALRKEVLHRRGVIACPAARQPGPSLDADDRAELDRLIARLKGKLAAAGIPAPPGI